MEKLGQVPSALGWGQAMLNLCVVLVSRTATPPSTWLYEGAKWTWSAASSDTAATWISRIATETPRCTSPVRMETWLSSWRCAAPKPASTFPTRWRHPPLTSPSILLEYGQQRVKLHNLWINICSVRPVGGFDPGRAPPQNSATMQRVSAPWFGNFESARFRLSKCISFSQSKKHCIVIAMCASHTFLLWVISRSIFNAVSFNAFCEQISFPRYWLPLGMFFFSRSCSGEWCGADSTARYVCNWNCNCNVFVYWFLLVFLGLSKSWIHTKDKNERLELRKKIRIKIPLHILHFKFQQMWFFFCSWY